MFEVPGSDIVDVIIDEDVVRGKSQARYVRHPVETERFENDIEENLSEAM
jgi:hypothetical protein